MIGRRTQRTISLGLAMLLTLMSAVSVLAYHEDEDELHDFADSRFENRWARTDYPVQQGAAVRTWIWGPSPFTEGMMEPYLDGFGGERLVQYFDKSRMELTNPDSEDTSIWTVTQGLLAWDLMDGWVQVGDIAFAEHSEGPSVENVAGDPGPNNGPTYAVMGELLWEDARAEGAYIVDWIDSEGNITQDNELANYDVTAYYNVQVDWIDHTIASPFWEFMNSEGLIWDGELQTGKLFENPFYATGYPLTEAYWAKVRVAGDEMDVLVQCFERRCLTYTPGNEDGWKVEAGNVGQHYYRWLETHQGPLVAEEWFETLATGLVNPRGATWTEDGVYVAEAGSGGDTCVEIGEGDEAFELCAGLSGAVTLVDEMGQDRVIDELPSLIAHEDAVGAHDVAFDGDGNMFIAMGFGGPPEARAAFGELGDFFATVVKVDTEGELSIVADLGDYEEAENPDGGEPDTNPYSIAWDDGDLIVVDAGGNSLLRVDPDTGDIELIAIFEQRMVPAPPFIPVPEIPMDSVPTNVVIGPDGNYYVSELTGFPFPIGEARVLMVTPDGDVSVYAEGFTNVLDLAFTSDGRLAVLEMVKDGLLNVDEEAIGMGDLRSAQSRIVVVDTDGTQTSYVVPGMYVATGLAIGDNQDAYVVNLSLTPFASLIRLDVPASDVDMDVQSFSTTMTGDEEVPPVATSATGSATFEVSQDGNSISFEVTLVNLSNTTMAHIHLAGAGVNGPVVAWLYPDSPPAQLIAGSFSGVLSSGTITAGDLVGPLEGHGIDVLIDAMIAGDTYVNVHTEAFPAGEIRGQIALNHDH
jgi:hypothetical protein